MFKIIIFNLMSLILLGLSQPNFANHDDDDGGGKPKARPSSPPTSRSPTPTPEIPDPPDWAIPAAASLTAGPVPMNPPGLDTNAVLNTEGLLGLDSTNSDVQSTIHDFYREWQIAIARGSFSDNDLIHKRASEWYVQQLMNYEISPGVPLVASFATQLRATTSITGIRDLLRRFHKEYANAFRNNIFFHNPHGSAIAMIPGGFDSLINGYFVSHIPSLLIYEQSNRQRIGGYRQSTERYDGIMNLIDGFNRASGPLVLAGAPIPRLTFEAIGLAGLDEDLMTIIDLMDYVKFYDGSPNHTGRGWVFDGFNGRYPRR